VAIDIVPDVVYCRGCVKIEPYTLAEFHPDFGAQNALEERMVMVSGFPTNLRRAIVFDRFREEEEVY
jgi:hypothetical protein